MPGNTTLRAAALALLSLAGCSDPASQDPTPRTLRLDYEHSGTATEESFRLDGLVREGAWAGPMHKRVDSIGYGKYFFEVRDAATGEIWYSRGFASIFGEWELTAEAKEKSATFHESLRFPAPESSVHVVLKKRATDNSLREVWSTEVDPAGAIDWQPQTKAALWPVIENGPPSEKADLLLLGDGYTGDEMDKWHIDARRLADTLFSESPFQERRSDFNVWALDTPAAESGVARPSDGVERDSPVGAAYDAMGSERYVLAFDNKRLRNIAAAAPYEYIEIVVNNRKYGGGGIFNLYATVAADNAFTPYIFVHEFGHHFAGLADEYYTSDVAYESGDERVEPWEPNVTAEATASKWSELLTPGVPLPTPWPKAEFEAFQEKNQARRRQIRAESRPEEEMEALFREEMAWTSEKLSSHKHGNAVGAFEGANYAATGYYRSQSDCIMFTRDEVGFCAVCRRAIERMIDLYTP